jgi:hypothetical protein
MTACSLHTSIRETLRNKMVVERFNILTQLNIFGASGPELICPKKNTQKYSMLLYQQQQE